MKSDKSKRIRTSVILEEDSYNLLEKLARKNDVSIAWVIRQAINQYLKKEAPKSLGRL